MKVLVVEDDTDLRHLIGRVLLRRGHEMVGCADAETAWAACRREAFPLVLLDRKLPGMDGLDLCRRLRAEPDGHHGIVIVVTGHVQPDELTAILDAGASDYLAKPFTTQLLTIRRTVAERQVAELAARQALEAQLRHRALHDAVTGLPNRTFLFDRLANALDRATGTCGRIAVLYHDLDGFKEINDDLGHDAGDRLLTAVGERLAGCVRGGDTVARIGGDEFVVLLHDVDHTDDAVRVAERMLAALRAPFRLGDREVLVSTSIGIALQPPAGAERPDLIQLADAALYRAKAAGRNGHAVFEPAMLAS